MKYNWFEKQLERLYNPYDFAMPWDIIVMPIGIISLAIKERGGFLDDEKY